MHVQSQTYTCVLVTTLVWLAAHTCMCTCVCICVCVHTCNYRFLWNDSVFASVRSIGDVVCVICIVWYCMVLYGTVWYCIVLYGIVWYCMVLYSVIWYCMVLYGIVLCCVVLYCIESYLYRLVLCYIWTPMQLQQRCHVSYARVKICTHLSEPALPHSLWHHGHIP